MIMVQMESNAAEYSLYEKRLASNHSLRTIDGRSVGCGKCVGYCSYDGHTGFLTADLRQKHNCCKKECYYYVPKQRNRIGK